MKTSKTIKRKYVTFLAVLLLASFLVGAGTPEYQNFDDLNGKTVSMLTGAPFEELVKNKAPDVKEFTYFNNMPDMALALREKKTDAVLINNAIGELTVNRNPGLAVFPENLADGVFGFAFKKGDPARDEWQKAYDTISEETKEALWEKWTGADDSVKTMPAQDWPGTNGTIKAAVCDTLEPMSYVGGNGELMGFDLEMILLIAKELDVHVDFVGMEFSAILSSVQSGKALIGAGSIIASDERRESVDFVDYYPAAFILLVRTTDSDGAATGDTNAADSSSDSDATKARTSKTLADVAESRIGVISGSNIPDLVKKSLPNATLEYYNSAADMIGALESDKVDALAMDEPVARIVQAENSKLAKIPELLDSLEYAFMLPKTPEAEKLLAELNEYIDELKQNGTLEELDKKWCDSEDISREEMFDYTVLPATNGTVNAAVFVSPPFAILKNGRYMGYEIELLASFCRDRGYALALTDLNVDGILPSVQSGKSDVGFGGFTVTEERKNSLYFTNPTYVGGTAVLVKADNYNQLGDGFWDSIKESFEKTFIRENRWQLFVSGIGTTLLITVLSIILGTLIGFAVFMLCRRGNPIANQITRFFIWLIQGMPVVVLLMILYYVVFSKVAIPGEIVSIMGFTLIFAAAVFGMLKSGVGAVDRGQEEAAYALGYPDREAFFKVILPQALPHFMPEYKGQIVSLIKATAIVGYVAVQDLTKIGDIVRSRTYEAFFPLIAIAIIYFILAGILTFIVNKIEFQIDPRRRSKDEVLKGVKTDD